MQSTNCPNCVAPLAATVNYRPQCGQKARLHRLSWHDIFHDIIHYFTHADKGVFSLIKELALRTGTVARHYVGGKRKTYFPPLNFFLIVAALFLFSGTVSKRFSPIPAAAQRADVERRKTAEGKANAQHLYERQKNVMQFMSRYANFVFMTATPLLAAIVWLFYIRGRYNYVEHLVANMYANGFTMLVNAILIIPLAYAAGAGGYIGTAVYLVFEIIYRSVFYYHFINKGTRASAVKAVAVSAAAILFWVLLSGGLVGWYIASGLKF